MIITILAISSMRVINTGSKNIHSKNMQKITPDITQEKNLTLSQARHYVLNHRAALTSQTEKIWEATYHGREKLSGFLPHITFRTDISQSKRGCFSNLSDADLAHFKSQNFSCRQVFPPVQVETAINQLLFSRAGPLQEYYIAKHTTEIERISYDLLQDHLRFETEQNFLSHWNILNKKRSVRAHYDAANHVFSRDKQSFDLGLLSHPEWAAQQALYKQAQADTRKYYDQKSLTLYSLERTFEHHITANLDNQSTTDFLQKSIAHAQDLSLNYYLTKAQQWRKEFYIQEEEIKRNRRIEAFEERFYVPTAHFFARFIRTTPRTNLSIFDYPSFWQAGIRFEWEFDGMEHAHRANAATAATCNSLASYTNTWATVHLEIQTAYHELQLLLKQVSAQELLLEQERVIFERSCHEHNLGLLSNVDFKQADDQWELAQFTYNDLLTKTAIKQRELLLKTGYPTQHELAYARPE